MEAPVGLARQLCAGAAILLREPLAFAQVQQISVRTGTSQLVSCQVEGLSRPLIVASAYQQ
eukprot:2957877-Alexandrium_andersonii.AAC.1